MFSRMSSSRAPWLVCWVVLTIASPALADAPADAPPRHREPATTSTPDASAPTPTPEAGAATRSEAIIARILSGITRVGPGAATMSRDARDLILSNLAILARTARAVPANDNGALGFRLFGIRSGSVLAALGLQNGDLLKSINGRPTTTPQEVLAAYSGLRGAGSWALDITRRGADMTLSVHVVDDASAGTAPPAMPPSGNPGPNTP